VTQLKHQSAERALGRLAIGLLRALAVVAAVPLGMLVRSRNPAIGEADERISAAAEPVTKSSHVVLCLSRSVTVLGEPALLTATALLLAALLAWRGKIRLDCFALAARWGPMLLSANLKQAVDRARPVLDEPVATALGASFPSGHALGSAAFVPASQCCCSPTSAVIPCCSAPLF